MDNEQKIARDISSCLQMRYQDVDVILADKGNKGINLVKKESPELVVINAPLPDIPTLELLGEIREFSDVFLLIITGEINPLERARELNNGADDIIVRPFTPIVLLAKIRALLRRTEWNAPNATVEYKTA
jgi:two-component system KDP operon response regulator KdpE